MPKVISALAARTQFGQIMRRARQQQERFVVDKRGEPQVVIMGIKDFLRTVAPEAEVLAAIRAEARRNKSNKLSLPQINREIAAFRRERRLSHATGNKRHFPKHSDGTRVVNAREFLQEVIPTLSR